MTAPGTRTRGDASLEPRTGVAGPVSTVDLAVDEASASRRTAELRGLPQAVDAASTTGTAPAADAAPSWVRLAEILALPLAFVAIGGVLAELLPDPRAGNEVGFLVFVGAGVLACVAALEPRWRAERATLALALAAMPLWLLAHEPDRAVASTMALVALLAIGGARAVRASGFSLRTSLALAFGIQLIVRPELLLPPLFEARTLVGLFALPILAAASTWLLARVTDPSRGALVFVLVAGLAPGWNVATTSAVAVLAAFAALVPSVLSAAGLTTAGRDRSWFSTLSSRLEGAGGVSGAAVAPGAAAIAPGAVLVALGAVLVALGAVVVVGLQLARGSHSVWIAISAALAFLRFRHSPIVLAGLGAALALVGWWANPDPQSTAAGLGLLALAWPPGGRAGRGARWLAVLWLVWAVSAAAYPWMRSDPWAAGRSAVGALATTRHVLHSGPPRVSTRSPIVFELSPGPPSSRSPEAPRKPLSIGPGAVIVVDTTLVHAAGLADASPVLWVELLDDDGAVLARRRWLVGRDTAEWAAGRADLAGVVPAPEPWTRSLAPDGTFFAQRYRATWTVEELAGTGSSSNHPVAARLRLRRAASLPAEVEVQVHRLEIRQPRAARALPSAPISEARP